MARTVFSMEFYKKYLLMSWIKFLQGISPDLTVVPAYPYDLDQMVTPTLAVTPLNIERFTSFNLGRALETEPLDAENFYQVFRQYYDATWQFDLYTTSLGEHLNWTGKVHSFFFDKEENYQTFNVQNWEHQDLPTDTSNTVQIENHDVETVFAEYDKESFYREVYRIPFLGTIYTKKPVSKLLEAELILEPG